MEACSGAHYWAREYSKLGHDIRIMACGKITATAAVATVNDAKHFDTSRSFAAWIGLVPRQYTAGGVARLGRISKRVEKHIRTSLIHGARAVIANCKNKTDRTRMWVKDQIPSRYPFNGCNLKPNKLISSISGTVSIAANCIRNLRRCFT